MPGRGGAFTCVTHTGPAAGPVVALLGGIHGDEEEGVLAVQRVSTELARTPLLRGTVRAVAVAHPAAYAADTRTSPIDGLNLARAFPGDPAGRATERLAHALTDTVIRGSDLLIDLHSAGRRYAMPTFVGYVLTDDDVGARARTAADAFGLPLLWEHPPPIPAGRTISAAYALGIPAVYVEGSGGGSLEHDEVSAYERGVLSVLADLGMVAGSGFPGPPSRRVVRGDGGDLDGGTTAPCDGRFVSRRRAGDAVGAGEPIGDVLDEDGRVAAPIVAAVDGTIMFLRRDARVVAGDVLCALGSHATPWRPTA